MTQASKHNNLDTKHNLKIREKSTNQEIGAMHVVVLV